MAPLNGKPQKTYADLREYLQEESRLLAPRPQVEGFLRAVDGLRADTDRLEKRLERLAGRTA